MATRTLSFGKWLKLVAEHALGNGFKNVAGYPPADVAAKLDVSHQRVSQLISEEVLDTIQVTSATGRVCITLVTEASIDRYLAKRVPDRNRQGYFAFQE